LKKKQFKNLNTKPAVINKKSNTHPTLVLTFLWAPTIILTSMFFHVKVYLLNPQKKCWEKEEEEETMGVIPTKLLPGFVGLAYQEGKDIVFRLIIEYSSLRDFRP